ncbi:M48 family metalloprotease [Alishewanella sp. SMS8]|uniref:beta-barrel assembly-enhancing protease n=1 Tax=unclassified Alishewanella TaxID=2628974 RepID=UPI002740BACF|nr:M48 family metalloprotease [Alishewanella sp. SMS8]MDP4946240.1 M48 family metalloprotease [Alishewanella sp.]MDP5034799.1 M48 family metalloprotease [Alishewanella sp.]MDP5185975.1 M48 family metalloprotease [Alishewanella sp.]MDP5457833.1 M48 family metalloprotease [Alishewanella sp. SMS8]
MALNTLPDIGGNAFSTLTPEKEKQIGDVLIRQTRARLPMVYDPLLDEYLNALGNRLVARSNDVKFPFKFYWVNNQEINAFASLGGNIVSHTGTLAVSESESEFASVIAHEVAHVTQRHIARFVEAQNQRSPLTIASLLGSIILATINPEAGMAAMAASQGAAQQSAINFTRSNEQEADRIGMTILAEAGFDPNAVPIFFSRLSQQSRFVNQQLAFLQTHPLSQARVSDTRLRAQQFPQRFVPDSQDFTLTKSRILARYHYSTKDALIIFERMLTEPGGNTRANHYGLAIAKLDNKNYEEALVLIEDLLKQDPYNLYYLDVYTDILIAEKKYEQAKEFLQQAYLLRPNNQVVTLNYANVAVKSANYGLAVHLLRNLLYYKDDNILAYDLLSEAYKAQEDFAKYYETRSDLFYQLANYPKAIDDLNEALNSLKPDARLENRRIEAKKRQLQAEFERLQRM